MEGTAGIPSLTDDEREGLLLCMLLAASLDPNALREEGREIARVACEEVEFGALGAEHFSQILGRAQEALHHPPDAVMARIRRTLVREEARRRALELAVRVVLADGIVRPEHSGFLAELINQLELPPEVLQDCVLSSQRRLMQLMLLYLADQAVQSGGELSAEEYEELFAFLLGLPIFRGVTTEQIGLMARTSRNRMKELRADWGLDYITSTICKGAELLERPELREQAMELVARGLATTNGKLSDEQDGFYRRVAGQLDIPEPESRRVLERTAQQ